MARSGRLAMGAVAGIALALLAALLLRRAAPPNVVNFVTGAVLRDDPDPQKQRPIANAAITALSGASSGEAISDSMGFFRIRLQPPVVANRPIRIEFRHPDYRPLEITWPAVGLIHVVRLTPASRPAEVSAEAPKFSIGNVRVRYALKSTTTVDFGSAAKIFELRNTGDVPCDGRPPCSPDGNWKAADGGVRLDAGAGKEFRNVRVSCIAGPCPFSRIQTDQFSAGGRVISVRVRNWSDTVTYLLEAEVAETMVSDMIRHSYPVIVGRTMDFTLPAAAQGPSIEAELEGAEIVFPLGPALLLSWANCRLEIGSEGTKLYRCELKPQYRFK